MPVIPATWEAEIGRIEVESQPGQKVIKTPSSINKMGIVVCSWLHRRP
jgi:hypothetical protein